MNTKGLFRLCIVSILAVLVLLAIALAGEPAAASPAAYDYSWTDDFNSPYPHPLWSWVRQDAAHWSLSASPGNLRIITQAGGVYGTQNNQKNILIALAPARDFEMSTRVTFFPTQNFQYAGIQVYQDDDNYIQLNWAYVISGTVVDLDREIGGTVTNIQVPAPAVATLYLKLERTGNQYTGYYSTNGSTWTEVGLHTAVLYGAKVSLAAANNDPAAEIPADFDWFKLEANFASFFSSSTDNFNAPPLDARWTWVNENPAGWSLTANPGHLRIITNNGTMGTENFLTQPAPLGDFSITTHELFTPVSDFQIASLVLFQDESNNMQLGRAYCSNPVPDCTAGNGIYFDFGSGGTLVENFATSVSEEDHAYLKIERTGDIYSGYYSGDGSDWQLIGRHKPATPFNPLFIGLTADQDFSQVHTPADFDSFTLTTNTAVFIPLVKR